MENKHLKIFKLVQHTPMWHFQSEEIGCCLRASEVKPKLDRFIAEKSGKPYSALNYKMSFIPSGKKKIINDSFFNQKGKKVNKFPLYFGNIKENTKKLILYPSDKATIEMRIFSLDTALLTEICEYINAFFACTSFGTRQDKGFGFFYPKDIEFNSSDASYCFDVPDIQGRFEELFNYIHYFHKMIRSGINERGVYYKSFMFHYARECGENWDKPVIRHHFQLFNPVYKHICGEPSTIAHIQDKFTARIEMIKDYSRLQNEEKYRNSHWIFRDALGLSNTQQWLAYNDTISIESANSNIKRFKSPITYRPVPMEGGRYRVFLYLSPIHPDYKEASFIIKNKPNIIKNKPKYGTPQLPMTDMKIYNKFSLDDYLDYVLNYCYSVNSISSNGRNSYVDYIFKKKDSKVNFRKINKSI